MLLAACLCVLLDLVLRCCCIVAESVMYCVLDRQRDDTCLCCESTALCLLAFAPQSSSVTTTRSELISLSEAEQQKQF